MTLQRKANQKTGAVAGLASAFITIFLITTETYQQSTVAIKALYFAIYLLAAWLSGFLTKKFLKRIANPSGLKELALTGLISGGATFSIFLILYSIIQLLR